MIGWLKLSPELGSTSSQQAAVRRWTAPMASDARSQGHCAWAWRCVPASKENPSRFAASRACSSASPLSATAGCAASGRSIRCSSCLVSCGHPGEPIRLEASLRPVVGDGLREFGAHELGAIQQSPTLLAADVQAFGRAIAQRRPPEQPLQSLGVEPPAPDLGDRGKA